MTWAEHGLPRAGQGGGPISDGWRFMASSVARLGQADSESYGR